MPFISLTRLRLRSIRFVPLFGLEAYLSIQQIRKAAGFQRGELLADERWTFWTVSAWDSMESMRGYMISGAHKRSMPHLLHWCDEASVAHWEQPEAELPAWVELDRRMRTSGRTSKVLRPSPHHADMSFEPVHKTHGAPIRRA